MNKLPVCEKVSVFQSLYEGTMISAMVLYFRDFMEVTMEKTNYILHYLLPLIGKASPSLRNFLEQ